MLDHLDVRIDDGASIEMRVIVKDVDGTTLSTTTQTKPVKVKKVHSVTVNGKTYSSGFYAYGTYEFRKTSGVSINMKDLTSSSKAVLVVDLVDEKNVTYEKVTITMGLDGIYDAYYECPGNVWSTIGLDFIVGKVKNYVINIETTGVAIDVNKLVGYSKADAALYTGHAGEFSFELYEHGTGRTWTESIGSDGKASFSIYYPAASWAGKTYTYTLTEKKGSGEFTYDTTSHTFTVTVALSKDGTKITSTLNGSDEYSFTNLHKPSYTNVSGAKTWVYGHAPASDRVNSVTIQLLQNGSVYKTKELTAAGNNTNVWSYVFENVLVADANGNRYTPETIDLPVRKTWNDDNNRDGYRPDSITVKLLRNGEACDSLTLTGPGWNGVFEDLPKYSDAEDAVEYVYTIEEVLEGDWADHYDSELDGHNIVNTHVVEKIRISGEKFWDDANDQDGIRPDSVTVYLKHGDDVVKTATVSAATGWKYAFDDLYKFANGQQIRYTIVEEPVEGYETTYDGWNITNTHEPEVMNIGGQKIWVSDTEENRPDYITIRLYGNEKVVAEDDISAADGWEYEWDNLPKYENGVEIDYEIVEEYVEDYTTTYDGYNVINTYTPGTRNITILKEWNDADNQDGKRPESITINLLANGKKVDSAAVTEQSGWKWNFTDLPKYEAGKEIVYTIEEIKVPGYETIISGYNVTNTHTPETVTVAGRKVWETGKYRNVELPESITVRLYADGSEIASTEAAAETGWAWNFGELPKYAAGEEIVYTVTEDAVADFIGEITGDVETGFTVTNTYNPKLGSLTITKTVKGDGADEKQAFTFTLTLTGMAGELSYIGAANGTFEASEPLTFKLAHGQSITVQGIIAGTTYEVTEAKSEDYTAKATGASGVISEGEALRADFVNTYDGENDEKSDDATAIPKTGDPGNRAAAPVLAGLAIMWLGVGYYVIKRKLFA